MAVAFRASVSTPVPEAHPAHHPFAERRDAITDIVAYIRARLQQSPSRSEQSADGGGAAMAPRVSRAPSIGIVCGSGLGKLSTLLQDPLVVTYTEMEALGFPQVTVKGHVGELVFGQLNGKFVVCMRGRFHAYEGYPTHRVALPIRVMAALGVRMLIVTNASGGVNTEFDIGDVMVIRDHIYFPGLSGHNPLLGPNDERFGPRFPPVNEVYSKDFQKLVRECAMNVPAFSSKDESKRQKRTLRSGVYFGVGGPSYETPHEILMIRSAKGDAVGMSTVPEVIQAAHCKLPILGLALITNRCMAPNDKGAPPSHREVLDSVKSGEKDVQLLVSEFVKKVNTDALPLTAASKHFENVEPNIDPLRWDRTKAVMKKCGIFSLGIGVAGALWVYSLWLRATAKSSTTTVERKPLGTGRYRGYN